MTTEQYYKLPGKKKVGYVFSKVAVFLSTVGAGIGAVFASGLELTTPANQVNFTFGAILLVGLGILAGLGRLKNIVKIKSVGWLIAFALIAIFHSMSYFLLWGIGLTSIPLLIDDMVVNPLWNNWVANNVE